MTDAQRMVWTYIVRFALEHDQAPSIRQIADGIGRSVSTVYDHVQDLVRLGLLEMAILPGSSRPVLRIVGAKMVIPEVNL